MTQLIGVIGYPLKHTLSPYFQQAALDYYQMDVCYEAWETEEKELPRVIDRLRLPEYPGANVTVPYKEAVMRLVDEVDDLPRRVGAVNTVVNKEGRLTGFNTDVRGFLQALHMDGGFEPENKRAVILGAGGAARAVSLALLSEKVGPLAIANRTLKRAEALVDSLAKYAGAGGTEAELHALSWHGPELREAIRNCHLVVNCTTLGMKYASQAGQFPLEADWISAGVLVYDLVYNPPETPLLKMAQKAGARALGGLPMLVYQGAASFSLWTGREAPVDIMFSAARKALSAEC